MKLIIVILTLICAILIGALILYRRQVNSICRQLRVHRLEDSSTEIFLDHIRGPFGKLQKELNEGIKKELEENAAAQKMETSRKQMIANMAHDIRTPLTSVTGYFQLLNETEDAEKRREYVDIIHGRLDDLETMLDDFFAYSASVSDDKKFEIETLNLTKFLSESLFLYYDAIEAKLGSPKIEYPEDDVYVYAEASSLKRVLQNVIKNAITHGNSGFKVSIERDEKSATISVENMTEEKLPDNLDLVFDRTYRSDPARSKLGTGLGLCIAKELTERMGGSIKAISPRENTFAIVITLKTSSGGNT